MIRIFLALILLAGGAQAGDFSAVEAKLEAAMEADIRSAAEVARDRNRKPVDTLQFFGLRDDMRVVELLPGAAGTPSCWRRFWPKTASSMLRWAPAG